MKGVQCYELFGEIALKIHTFSFFHFSMNGCTFCFFLFTPRLERLRCGGWYPMLKSLRRPSVERLSKDVFVPKERSSVTERSSVLVYE